VWAEYVSYPQAQTGLTGKGVTIGVISDSVNSNNGDGQDLNEMLQLKIVAQPVEVLTDWATATDEGAAMINIVRGIHDRTKQLPLSPFKRPPSIKLATKQYGQYTAVLYLLFTLLTYLIPFLLSSPTPLDMCPACKILYATAFNGKFPRKITMRLTFVQKSSTSYAYDFVACPASTWEPYDKNASDLPRYGCLLSSLPYSFADQQTFAKAIRDLAAQGAKVIVDDITYFREEVFQEGIVEQAVNDVMKQGVLYFTSATNQGNLVSGRRNTYVATYNPTRFTNPPSDGHNFLTGPNNIKVTSTINVASTPRNDQGNIVTTRVVFQYSVPSLTPNALPVQLGVFFQDANGVVSSCTPAAGTTKPVASCDILFVQGVYTMSVIQTSGSFPATIPAVDRRFFIQIGADYLTSEFATSGSSYGHNAPIGSFGVASVNIAQQGATKGDITKVWNDKYVVEPFSSDGGTSYCFDRTGKYLGCVDRNQPIVTGPDGGTTSSVSK